MLHIFRTPFLKNTFGGLLLNKGHCGSNIQLVEGNELIQDDQKIADELNTFFKNAVLDKSGSNLDINENKYIINHDLGNLSDRVDRVMCNSTKHSSYQT